jgi:hypothetical protein
MKAAVQFCVMTAARILFGPIVPMGWYGENSICDDKDL